MQMLKHPNSNSGRMLLKAVGNASQRFAFGHLQGIAHHACTLHAPSCMNVLWPDGSFITQIGKVTSTALLLFLM